MCSNWELRVLVTDLQVERTLLVRSDLHVGGVMIQLVDELGKHLPTPSAPADSIKFAFDNRFRICPFGWYFICLFVLLLRVAKTKYRSRDYVTYV